MSKRPHTVTAFYALMAVLPLFTVSKLKAELPPEAADPEARDLSVWKDIKPGLHSGFGSVDVAYPKSIPPAGDVAESIKLQGWKGERVHCQLLVWSPGAEENIRITASGFSGEHFQIEQGKVSISVVNYVLTDAFPGGIDRPDKSKFPVQLKPDRLSRTNGFNLDAPGTRPVWISVDIPAETPAGIYQGTISRQSASGTVNHSMSVEVLNATLPAPSEWSFHLDLWQHPDAVARYGRVALWSPEHLNLLRPMLTMLAQAGQKCITTTLIEEPWNHQTYDDFGGMIKWTKRANGTWTYDYSRFDTYVALAMECGITRQINCYSMVPVGNKISWYDEKSAKSVTAELLPGTAEYETVWRSFLLDFKVHLREKGWLDKTSIALDEREEEEMEKMFSFLKETAPELKISMAGFYYEKVNPSIYDFSSNWRHIDKISGGIVESRRRSGLKTTYYVACGIPKPNTFTFSPPSESCYQGWFVSAMGFDGFLRWAYNSWVENPEVDSRFIKWPSGDAYLVYPNAQSSIRFERLREGIQDYEKIRILREELARNPSAEAAAAKAKLNEFMSSMNTKTLDNKSAADVINQGKQLLSEIVRSVYPDRPAAAAGRSQDSGLKLMGNRFLTFSTIVRVNQIETSREEVDGADESSVHGPEEARAFRDAVEKGWPGARIAWGFSWLALKDLRTNYVELRKLVASYHEKYGDEITFIPGGYFANMYNSREQVNRDLHDGLQMVSEMVGGGYRPQSVIAGFLAAENLRFLAEKEGIHVCQGNIWSQYAVDNGDGEGSICYPYYPSREHFCKPAQGKEDLIDCVNLDGWTVDFLCARYPRARMINGIRCGSRQGVGPIETILRMGAEQGTKAMLATTAAHFDTGFGLNGFAWVTCIWELCLVKDRKTSGYNGRIGMDGLVIWLSEMRRRWPEAKCITHGEFGMLWRGQFKNNDNLNYRFVQRGSGIGGSDAEMEIRWFMNKDFRLALLRNWQDNTPEELIDLTRYDLKAQEPADPAPGQNNRNWSLFNRLNQKGVRPQDKPISIGQLNADEQAVIKRRYRELIHDNSKPLLHPLFADHAVLQRDARVPVWGWAAPGAKITVEFARQKKMATAGADGAWRVHLDAMKASSKPREMIVTSSGGNPPSSQAMAGQGEKAGISDVLVGDVWICSGQSNMEMGMGMCGVSNEIAAADFPLIRLLIVPKKIAYTPELTLQCSWLPCSPTTVMQGGWGGFSAAGYFFGRELHRGLDVPIGLIETSWGGTVCEAWTSREALTPLGDFAAGIEQVERVNASPEPDKLGAVMDKWYQANDPGTSKAWFQPETDVSTWKAANMPADWQACGLPGYEGIVWAQRTFEAPAAWAGKELVLSFGPIGDVDTTWVNGIAVGRTDYFDQPRTYKVPAAAVKTGRNVIAMRVVNAGGGGFFGTSEQMKVHPSGDESSAISLAGPWRVQDTATRATTGAALVGNPNICTVLYNGMIAPLIPFAIKGVVWYQGESNAERAYQYRALLQTMIRDWRSRFGVGDFGFHIVSLANYREVFAAPRDSDWAELREAQAMAAKALPNCGIAMAIDIGEAADIHPRDKQEVGRRLALSALAITYGKKIEWSGPWYKSMKITRKGITLSFDHAQSGLIAKGDKLAGFAIAGEDRRFIWADAVIDGKTVLVSSPVVRKPVAVRYGWDANPTCNLFNKENLPAVPFRTDDWPGITVNNK